MAKSSSPSRRRPASRWRRNGVNGADSFSAMDWGAWLEGNGGRAPVGTADDVPVLLANPAGTGVPDHDLPPWPDGIGGGDDEIEIMSGRGAAPAGTDTHPAAAPERRSERRSAGTPVETGALPQQLAPAPVAGPARVTAPPRIAAPPPFPPAARAATPVPTPAAPPVFPRATPADPAPIPLLPSELTLPRSPDDPADAAEPTRPSATPAGGSPVTFPSRRSMRGQASPVAGPQGTTTPETEPRLVPPSHAAPYVPATLFSEDPPDLPRRRAGGDLDREGAPPDRARRGNRPHARHSRRGRPDEADSDLPPLRAPWLDEPPYTPEFLDSRSGDSGDSASASTAPSSAPWQLPDESLGRDDSAAGSSSVSTDGATALDTSEVGTTRRRRPGSDPLAPTVLPESPRPARGRGRLVLPACAGLLALWATTSLIDTRSSLLIAAAALCPAIAVLAVPMAALAVRGRRWITLVVTVLAGLLPWALVVGYALPGPGVGPTPGNGSLRLQVMTINAQLGRADAAQIVATVHSRRVDVLVVTELTGLLAHDLTGAGLGGLLPVTDWVPLGTSAIGGIGVWSRYQVADASQLSGTRWPAARVVLATPAGDLPMIVGHVSPPVPGGGGAWHTDLRLITAAAAGGSRAQLVVGDLNATPWNTPFRQLTSSGMRDAADVLGHGLRNTWPQWLTVPPVALDHVLVSDALGVRSVDTAVVDGTDHRALIVGLTVPRQTG